MRYRSGWVGGGTTDHPDHASRMRVKNLKSEKTQRDKLSPKSEREVQREHGRVGDLAKVEALDLVRVPPQKQKLVENTP